MARTRFRTPFMQKLQAYHGRRKGGQGSNQCPHWILNISAKKGCFLSFEWKKQISPLLATPRKTFGKIHQWPSLEKILPTTMRRTIFCAGTLD